MNLDWADSWEHHRSGWRYCVQCLRPLHRKDGVLFRSYIDGMSFNFNKREALKRPWIGFIHNPPKHPHHVADLYHGVLAVDDFLKTHMWKRSAKLCVGLFCLSQYLYDHLKQKTNVPLDWVWHPTETPDLKFTWEKFIQNDKKQVVTIGHWLRNFQSAWDLKSPYTKSILKGSLCPYKKIEKQLNKSDRQPVGEIPRLDNEQFDKLLAENLIFLPLYDSSANNSIIECIVRNTPILTNRLPASMEYLGKNYPLFYDTLEEAAEKLKNLSLIRQAHEYLCQMDKTYLSGGYFLQSIQNSHIYQLRNQRVRKLNERMTLLL